MSRDEQIAPVFQLAELKQLYRYRMEQPRTTGTFHLPLEEPLAHYDMICSPTAKEKPLCSGRCWKCYRQTCVLGSDKDAINLPCAAKIVHCRMFEEAQLFSGLSRDYQKKSVPPVLLALVSVILDGPSIKDQMIDKTSAAVTIVQML